MQGIRRFLVFHAALVLCLLGTGEIATRVRPELLPLWYQSSLPMNGVELFHARVLSTTPIEGYPLPGLQRSYEGIPPADLVQVIGMVAPEANPDPVRFPNVRIPIDELGFPNERALEQADIVVLGDSFAFSAGVATPSGLCRELENRTKLSVYDLGIPGIGPVREGWLLENYGLALRPRVVVWLFFGGNDLADAAEVQLVRELGVRTFADLPDYHQPPPSRVIGLFNAWASGAQPSTFGQLSVLPPPTSRRPYVPGVHLRSGPHADVPLWFAPGYLVALVHDESTWRADPGFTLSTRAITAARDAANAAGARFLLVYLPSKPQALLPWVEPDLSTILDMATFESVGDTRVNPNAVYALALANRGSLEVVMREMCEEEGIPFLSGTPYLEAQARDGVLGYLSADTHWNERGQLALLEPIAAEVTRLLSSADPLDSTPSCEEEVEVTAGPRR